MTDNILDPETKTELEQIEHLLALLEKHPGLKIKILWSYTKEIQSLARTPYEAPNQIENAIFAACCEWDVTP